MDCFFVLNEGCKKYGDRQLHYKNKKEIFSLERVS